MYYIVFCFVLFGGPAWRLFNVSVQYNDGFLHDDIILLTQGYYHQGTLLNVMTKFVFATYETTILNT